MPPKRFNKKLVAPLTRAARRGQRRLNTGEKIQRGEQMEEPTYRQAVTTEMRAVNPTDFSQSIRMQGPDNNQHRRGTMQGTDRQAKAIQDFMLQNRSPNAVWNEEHWVLKPKRDREMLPDVVAMMTATLAWKIHRVSPTQKQDRGACQNPSGVLLPKRERDRMGFL